MVMKRRRVKMMRTLMEGCLDELVVLLVSICFTGCTLNLCKAFMTCLFVYTCCMSF